MMFLDEARVTVRSGNGGVGCVSFLRERNREFGGPDGGNGGDGGSVYAKCVASLNTLTDYRYRQHVFAGNGRGGSGKQRSGGRGDDATLLLPRGTQVWHGDTLLAELTAVGQVFCLARGGRGGLGNYHFRSSVNRAPRKALPGEVGAELELTLTLKLFADVGVIGLPNAGKSTFVSVVSAARPKVADYPFTTLRPSLGTVELSDSSFVVADIPGLIEGAHAGIGLGSRFLRHVERCSTLLHLIPATSQQPAHDYQVTRNELRLHSASLANKPEVIAITKTDLVDSTRINAAIAQLRHALAGSEHREVTSICAVTRAGIMPLLHRLQAMVAQARLGENDEASSNESKYPHRLDGNGVA